jgi:hypothetical protein
VVPSVLGVVVDIVADVLGDVVVGSVAPVGSVPVPVSFDPPSSAGQAVSVRRRRPISFGARTRRRYHRAPPRVAHRTSTRRWGMVATYGREKKRDREHNLDRRWPT